MTAERRILAVDGVDYPLEVRRNARARRVLLRLARGSDQGLVLTLPPRASLGSALRWASAQGEFVRRSLARQPTGTPFAPDAIIPVEGRDVRIHWTPAASRVPLLDQEVLALGGPEQFVAGRVERWLKARALDVMTVETRDMALTHGLPLGRVSIGDPKGRWGSCASNGNIRYSWRLILAPPHVRRAVVAHEVAHIAHPNHGRDFHALVDRILGEPARPAYAWLKRHGAGLHWVGRLG